MSFQNRFSKVGFCAVQGTKRAMSRSSKCCDIALASTSEAFLSATARNDEREGRTTQSHHWKNVSPKEHKLSRLHDLPKTMWKLWTQTGTINCLNSRFTP